MIASLDLDERSIELIVTQTVSPITNLETPRTDQAPKTKPIFASISGSFFQAIWVCLKMAYFHEMAISTKSYGEPEDMEVPYFQTNPSVFSDSPAKVEVSVRQQR